MKQACMLALMLLAAGALPAMAQDDDCGLHQLAAIDITVTPDRITVPVGFGDARKDMVLRLDGPGNRIADATARELGLKLGALPQKDTMEHAGEDGTALAHADDIRLGKARMRNVDFLVTPQAGGAVGAVGTGLFDKADFELDTAGGKLVLFSSDHCPGKVVHWTRTGFVTVPLIVQKLGYLRLEMQLDGKTVQMALNTQGGSRIGMNAMRRIFGVDETSPGMTAVETLPNGRKLFRYPFKALQAGGLAIANPAILVEDEPRSTRICDGKAHTALDKTPTPLFDVTYESTCFGAADGMLGLPVLEKLHMYFSKKDKLVFITGANAK